ncbi:MAG: GtrA family protein [Erysipelotrichaceae bacterium]|nr:GtrA family protein [Erysipelotrichaceae bacterium]
MEENKRTVSETKPQFAVFDWIVSLPVIRILKPLYEWKRAFWIYCFLGFVSVVVNFVAVVLLRDKLHMLGTVANLIGWVVSVLVSFILFRYFYFDRTNNSFIAELLKFASARLFTLGFESLVVFLFVDLWGIDITIVKAVLIPVTATLNYFISKIFVFKNKEEK